MYDPDEELDPEELGRDGREDELELGLDGRELELEGDGRPGGL